MNSPQTWPQIVAQLDNYRPSFRHTIVRWSPPPAGLVKCNTDGASKGKPGPSSASFCEIDHNGNLVGAKGVKLTDSYNLVAEATAIREGLQYCLDKHFHQIVIETNSLSMINILNGEWDSPLSVTMEVNSINRI
ncbi:hypothetical protein KY284_020330 [Solanum tuberosum]|nr:hypothetical protein KY284_020330 [Solanum tuberosum]